MPWVRFEDNYLANEKIKDLSPFARLLDIAGIMFSARELRDGLLTESDVRTTAAIAHVSRWRQAVTELCGVGRWVRNADGSYLIHDYFEYQKSRAQIEAERALKQAAGRVGGQASAQARASSESKQVLKQVLKQNSTPVPGSNSVTGELSPAGPARPARAHAPTREDEAPSPQLLAEHLRRLEQERASQARPGQPSEISSETTTTNAGR